MGNPYGQPGSGGPGSLLTSPVDVPEHVGVAGRGVVATDGRVPGMHDAGDRGRQIDVDPTALALTVLAAVAANAARGLVAGDGYILEVHGGRTTDIEAAALGGAAVAARAAGAAPGLVPGEGAVAEGDRPVRVEAGAIDLDGAPAARAAVGAFPAGPAGGLVVGERALAKEEAGEYQGAG